MLRFLVTLTALLAACVGTAGLVEAESPHHAAGQPAQPGDAVGNPPGKAPQKTDLEEYWRSHAHRRQAPGAPPAPEWTYYKRRYNSEVERVFIRLPYVAQMDRAWTVMLYKQGLITKQVAVRLLTALEGAEGQVGYGGEGWLKSKLDGDEDTASAVNFGRTLQEPMSRLQQRDKLIDVLDLTLKTLAVTLDVAEANADTIMAGQTHLSHAQPTTYGAYLLSVHDGLARGLEQLELAYKHTDENSAGCGALAGTGWPALPS